ncbi:beta-2-glycoprotein 1-like [Argopecten irradians]|uniref:beta-2-glycoprotein 1-like n=1 Tax=Argopecten irradians TaxID=31199 RepID=UPI0037196A02
MNNTGPPTFTNVTLGSTVTYTCLPGYTMENPADKTRTCQLNSAWSGSPPVCNPVECPPISSVLFASYQETGNVFRDNVTYQCDTGFPHLSGNLFRTCKADGTWSGIDPVCEYCDCPCDGSNVTSFKLNNATLEELLAALKAELQVDKKSTSMAVRRKISVYEDRPVAKGLGAMGVVLLVFVFAFVIIPDIPRLNTDIKMGYHNLFSCSGKKE